MPPQLPEEPQVAMVRSQDFLAELLAPGCALLTYRVAHVDAERELEQAANRSFIWQLMNA